MNKHKQRKKEVLPNRYLQLSTGGSRSELADADFALVVELQVEAAAFGRAAQLAAAKHPPNWREYGPRLTVPDLSRLTGLNNATIRRVLNGSGSRPPDLLTLARLARGAGKKLRLVLGD